MGSPCFERWCDRSREWLRAAHTAVFLALASLPKAEAPVLATGCPSFIQPAQQALVILLIERVLGVERGGRAVFLQSPLPVAFLL
jgi:hypothetical protein